MESDFPKGESEVSATQPPEPDIEKLESSDTRTSAKAAIKYLGDLRKYAQQKQRERRDEARAKVESELNNARQLGVEATALTRNLRGYF